MAAPTTKVRLDDILSYLHKVGGVEVMQFDSHEKARAAKERLLLNFKEEELTAEETPKVTVSELVVRIYHPRER